MAIANDLEWAVVAGLFFATMGANVYALAWGVLLARKAPPELVQLRIFENHVAVQRILSALTAGLLSGLVALSPFMLRMQALIGWTLAWAAVWAGLTLYGLFTAIRLFRVPTRSSTIAAREAA